MIRTLTGRITSAVRFTADAVRSVVAPAALVTSANTTAAVADTTAPDPADVYTDAEMPAAEDIAAAAAQYAAAADLARAGDRGKRAAKKVLARLPQGRYGLWVVQRRASSRQTVDLDAVKRLLKAHGYDGPVPMKPNAPSLVVSKAPADALGDDAATAAHMTALASAHPASAELVAA
ncbi:hypothetical protein [Streptomyces erythrochromogenes]|uniref:hypothetical protein n=1 Tax=Streptomyces erythrochromogenes TaxID=285574 RepID=UPI003868BD5C|nr:hypothetical protein OG364_29645 [Streptomyces erythrochromogenes]